MQGHTEFVHKARFLADGKRIESSANDGRTIIWNAETGELLRAFEEGEDGFSDAPHSSMSPDGKLLAVAQIRQRTLALWDIATGKKVRDLDSPDPSVSNALFSPNGEMLGTSIGNNVVLWETKKWQVVRSIERNERLRNWQFSPDSKLIVISTGQGIEIWDAATGRKQTDVPVALPWKNISISPDNQMLVAAPKSHNILIYNVADQSLLRTLTDRMGTVRSTMFHPAGRILASGDAYKKIFLWDVTNGKKLFEIQDPQTSHVSSVHFSSDGKQLVSGHADGRVTIWKVEIQLLR